MADNRMEGVSDRDRMLECLARVSNSMTVEIDGWEHIRSAPLDGTLIRVRDGVWSPCHARFVDGHWLFEESVSFLPTLWQQLNARESATATEAKAASTCSHIADTAQRIPGVLRDTEATDRGTGERNRSVLLSTEASENSALSLAQ